MKIKKKWEGSKQKEFGGISGRIRKKTKKKKTKKKGEEGRRKKKTDQKEREKKKRKRGFLLLSKIYGDRTVDFRRSKRQSSSTRRELRMGTKIWEFCQTPRGREVSYLDYF